MIKQRCSLAFSLLWRTHVVYFIYSALLSLTLGFTVGSTLLTSRDFLLFGPPATLALLALLLVVLEVASGVNVPRAVFGNRLKRSAAQWRTYVLQLSLLLTALAILHALFAFFAPFEVWVNYRVYGGPLLFTVGLFLLGWAQAPSSANDMIAAQAEDAAATSAVPKWP
ncbi:septation protein IspZ [Pseudomonas sp. BR20]|uniref:septation protein IspZ n=1 Tax=Pseudomonas sp. BR20 TaxID=3137452 RepID=UPI003D6DB4C5